MMRSTSLSVQHSVAVLGLACAVLWPVPTAAAQGCTLSWADAEGLLAKNSREGDELCADSVNSTLKTEQTGCDFLLKASGKIDANSNPTCKAYCTSIFGPSATCSDGWRADVDGNEKLKHHRNKKCINEPLNDNQVVGCSVVFVRSDAMDDNMGSQMCLCTVPAAPTTTTAITPIATTVTIAPTAAANATVKPTIATTKATTVSAHIGTGTWVVNSANTACENAEGITRLFGDNKYNGNKFTLDTCKSKCRSDPRCTAIDFFTVSGWCSTFPTPCNDPRKRDQGASSYTWDAGKHKHTHTHTRTRKNTRAPMSRKYVSTNFILFSALVVNVHIFPHARI